jgi:F-type H+-transporting ATPase subunit b
MLNLDAKQIIIQIIAFLAMLWVMKKYGWKPLLETMAARRKKIQEEFDSIAAQKKAIEQLTAQYEEKLREIDKEARKKIQEGYQLGLKIQQDAQVHAKEFLQKATAEIETELVKAKNQLKSDIASFVISTTEKILQEKLDDSSQKRLITHFIEGAEIK